MNTTKSDPVKIDLEQLLREGNIIRIRPQGYSMYPLFIPERDEALIQQTDGELMAARVWQWQTGQILMEPLL